MAARDQPCADAQERSPEDLLKDTMRLLPWRTRVSLTVKWAVRDIAARLPGYATAMRLSYRMKRQGISGLWEPPFSPNAIRFDRVARRLPWHGWGVLAEGDGFRAYTPTSRTVSIFSKPNPARFALKDRYYNGRNSDEEWEPLVAARAIGPRVAPLTVQAANLPPTNGRAG